MGGKISSMPSPDFAEQHNANANAKNGEDDGGDDDGIAGGEGARGGSVLLENDVEPYLYPSRQDDHFFEWSDLIAALLNAKMSPSTSTGAGDDQVTDPDVENVERRFNMLELGAGWAKWIVDAAALARQLNFAAVAAVGIEAQPAHCKMADEHMATNNAVTRGVSMICAAVGAEDGELEFPIDNSGDAFKGKGKFGYGAQMILDGKRWGEVRKVKAIGVCSLVKLAEFGGAPIDFVSLDVQSFEHAILNDDAVSCMDSMVRKGGGGFFVLVNARGR